MKNHQSCGYSYESIHACMYKEIYAPSQWKKKRNKKDNNDREVAQVP